MAWNWSLMATVNVIFCGIIFIIGYIGLVKKSNRIIWDIAVAFGLFGLSHLLTIAGFDKQSILLAIRALAYLLVISALLKALLIPGWLSK